MTTDRIDDPKLRFYLERRELIDEWASLSDLESAAANRFFTSVGEDIQLLAEDLGEDVVGFAVDVGGEMTVALAKQRPPETSELPPVLVGMGWYSRRPKFAGRDRRCPWIGLRARKSGEYLASHQQVREQLLKHPAAVKYEVRPPSVNSNWLVYNWHPCTTPNYWDDLSEYRESLVNAVAAAWEDFQDFA